MEKVIIGKRLGKRIKEMGYTRQEFAEVMGIKEETLNKYISGRNAYSLQLLIEFAEKLDCSYDYLLGYSLSSKREYHEIAEQTRLSEKAIEKIVKYASFFDEEAEAKRYIRLLDKLICEDGVLNTIFDYFISLRTVNAMNKKLLKVIQNGLNEFPAIKKLGMESDRILSLEEQQMIKIVEELKDMKLSLSSELKREIEELDTEEKHEQGMKKLEQIMKSEELANLCNKVMEICEE